MGTWTWSIGVVLCVGAFGCSSATESSAIDDGVDPDSVGPDAAGSGGAGAKGVAGSGGRMASGGSTGRGGSAGAGGNGGSGATGGHTGTGASSGSGGATATGGAAGTGGTDAGPHVVRPCSGATVGEWEDVSPPGVNHDPSLTYGFVAFAIDPLDTATLYAGTDHLGIYKTTDCGGSWQHVNTGRNGAALDSGAQWTMAIDPIDPQGVVYTNGGYSAMGVFKTTNGGVDWDQILPPDIARVFIYGGFVHSVRMDPTDPQHLTVSPHFTCESGHPSNCMLETTDGGTTWTVIDNIPGLSGEGTDHFMVDRDTWFWSQGDALYRTADRAKTWQKVYTGQVTASYFKAPNGTLYLAGASVLRSTDGVSWAPLSGSPYSMGLAGSSTTLYTSFGLWFATNPPFLPVSYAALSSPTSWKQLPGPLMQYGGNIKYDEDHHILYSSSFSGGFWRVRTE